MKIGEKLKQISDKKGSIIIDNIMKDFNIDIKKIEEKANEGEILYTIELNIEKCKCGLQHRLFEKCIDKIKELEKEINKMKKVKKVFGNLEDFNKLKFINNKNGTYSIILDDSESIFGCNLCNLKFELNVLEKSDFEGVLIK